MRQREVFPTVVSAQSTVVPLCVGDSLTGTAFKTIAVLALILNCSLVKHKYISITKKEQAKEEIIKSLTVWCQITARLDPFFSFFFVVLLINNYTSFSPVTQKPPKNKTFYLMILSFNTKMNGALLSDGQNFVACCRFFHSLTSYV